jgi:hypothetical protein
MKSHTTNSNKYKVFTMNNNQQSHINTLFAKVVLKLDELNMSDEETMQVLSRAIIASAVSLEKGSVMINYGNETSVNVNLPDVSLQMNELATTQQHSALQH